MKDKQKGFPGDSGRGAKINTERKTLFRLTAKPAAGILSELGPRIADVPAIKTEKLQPKGAQYGRRN